MLELFISGFEKNSRKTVVTAGLSATMQSLGYSCCVYKPIQTNAQENKGFIQAPDLAFIKYVDSNIKTYFSYLLKSDALPAVASEIEQTRIDKDLIYKDYQSIKNDYECILTDGTMGFATPIAENFLEQDMIKMLNIPVILVVSPDENSINNIIININQATAFGIKIRGVIVNNCPQVITNVTIKSMPQLIEKYTDTKILGVLPEIDATEKLNPNDLISSVLSGINLEKVFDVKIAKLEL